MRYSKCSVCGEKTDTYVGTESFKLGPCCTRPEKGPMMIVGIGSQEELAAWYKKFRPSKNCPQIQDSP